MLASFAWALGTLILVQLSARWIHRHLQWVGYRLSGSRSVALIIYSTILLPGVLLHELSHWLSAALLGVRTGRISLFPSVRPDGRLQLGAVEYYRAGLDPIRESIIGAAPLVAGCAALLLIAGHLLGFPAAQDAIAAQDLGAVLGWMQVSLGTPDFWLWFYLAFAIANAMMPSAADRRAWPAFLVVVGAATGLLLALGLSDWIVLGLEGPLALGAGYLASAFTVTIIINLVMMGLLKLLETLLGGR